MSSTRIPYDKSQQALRERYSARGYDSRGTWVPDEARLAPGEANRRAYEEEAPHYYTTSGTTSDAEPNFSRTFMGGRTDGFLNLGVNFSRKIQWELYPLNLEVAIETTEEFRYNAQAMYSTFLELIVP
ncbi:hypothetical protein VTN96DRAFT_1352 [Rasamsonia emersonii]